MCSRLQAENIFWNRCLRSQQDEQNKRFSFEHWSIISISRNEKKVLYGGKHDRKTLWNGRKSVTFAEFN